MKKGLFILPIFLGFLGACSSERDTSGEKMETNTLIAPIMLDDIHYYVNDRDSARNYFMFLFDGLPMAQTGENPFLFIDFIQVNPMQSTVNVSGSGPFPGMRAGDPRRWQRRIVSPSPEMDPVFGVEWMALRSKDLSLIRKRIEKHGIPVHQDPFEIPGEPNVQAISIFGPEYSKIVIIERPDMKENSPFAIDHLLFLNESSKANFDFFEGVFAGKALPSLGGILRIMAGGHEIRFAEPEHLNLKREKVARRNPEVFRFGIDHIGFLYDDVYPAVENAKTLGYQFYLEPTPMEYYDKPTVYTFSITFNPDGLQCEMYMETYRKGPRTEVIDSLRIR